MRPFLTVSVLVLVVSVGVFAQSETDCSRFLASNQAGELFSIDPFWMSSTTDGSSVFIGLMPLGTTEIEFNFDRGTLFVEGSDGDSRLFEIDPTTGDAIGFVEHEYGALNGMEYVGPVLYATFIGGSQNPSTLVIVDVETGSLTPVGPTGLGPISGLAYDPLEEVMWGVTAPTANLITLDLASGVASLVAPVVSAAGQQLERVGSIEFGPDGNLYGGLTEGALLMPGHLVQIDTTTGVASSVNDTGSSITGLTSCFSGIVVPVDITPKKCPNRLNVKNQVFPPGGTSPAFPKGVTSPVKKRGKLAVGVLGAEDFDVSWIDPESVLLEGVPVAYASFWDVGTPLEVDAWENCSTDCTDAGPDGLLDLFLMFDKQDVIAALYEVYGGFSDGDCLVVRVTGTLLDGTRFVGEDVVLIIGSD